MYQANIGLCRKCALSSVALWHRSSGSPGNVEESF